MKKFFKLLMALILLSIFTVSVFAGGSKETNEYHWRWSHYQPIDSTIDKISKAVVAEIAEKTNGRIKIDIYPANQLGDWMEVSEQIMRGSVEIGLMPVSPSYDQRLQVRVLPYSVMNYDEAKDAYLGDDPYLLDIMSDVMESIDLKALAVVAEGFGGGGFAEIPAVDVLDPEVNKGGLKMRFPPGNQAWENLVKSLGFAPTPVPWGELYMALQTKLIDCQIGGQPYNTYTSFRDVVKCWVQYNTHFQNSFMYMNSDIWEKLSKEDQTIIKEACMRQSLKSFEEASNEDAKYMKLMSDAGIKIIIPTDKQLLKISTMARKEIWTKMDDVIGKEIMDKMRKKVGL